MLEKLKSVVSDENSEHENVDVLVETDTAIETISSKRRREVIKYINESDESSDIRLANLSKEIAAHENDKSVSGLNDSERKRMYVSLYQTHLPKLDGFGVLDFNKDEGTVSANEKTEQVSELIKIIEESTQ